MSLEIKFDRKGLVPVVVQDASDGTVLMVAYMNEESLKLTLETGFTTFYSRSRQQLWKKGETSGNLQKVKEVLVDCDQDCILVKVEQQGQGACHTGARTCFYRDINGKEINI